MYVQSLSSYLTEQIVDDRAPPQVTDVNQPYGGWLKFGQQGLNDNYLAVWLANAGINNYYVGKFLNNFGEDNLATPAPPKGWTNSTYVFRLWKNKWFRC